MENNKSLKWKKKISLLWFGQSISLLTSAILQMCIIWYLTKKTESATIVTFATLAGYMPQALLGPFVGALIDRFTKKSVLIFSDLFIGVTSLVLAFFAIKGDLPIWLILLILVFRSIGTSFHEPTAQALTPLIVPKEHLARYAGFAQAFESISMILSPSLAVLFYELWQFEYIMFLDVLGALIAVTLLLFVKFKETIPQKTTKEKKNLGKDVIEGFMMIKDIKGILPLIVVGFFYSAIYSPVGSLYPHMTLVYFSGTTGQSAIVEILFSVGSLVGALLLGMCGDKISKNLGLFGSIFIYGFGTLVIGLLSPDKYIPFAIISFFIGTSTPFYHGIVRAIFQIKIPQQYLGRAFSISQSARRFGMPIGLLLGGNYADRVGVNFMYVVAGSFAVLLSCTGFFIKSLNTNED